MSFGFFDLLPHAMQDAALASTEKLQCGWA
jgi:hypothetical protein